MKISIAMATCNGAQHLQAQLDSFTAQTRLPDELVITDDCSSDGTVDIVKAYASRAPFEVRWAVNEKNLGYAANFNAAMSLATGDLVFLSDQDDVWFLEKLEVMEASAEESKEALVLMNDAVLTDADLNSTGRTKLGQTRAGGYGDRAFVMGCCMVIRRALLDLCLPVPVESEAHDRWVAKIAEGLGKRLIIDKPLQYYRRHGSNESDFIVNRIRGISMPAAFLDRATAALSGKQGRQLRSAMKETEVLVERVAQMRQSQPDWLPQPMATLQRCLEKELSIRRARLDLRAQPRHTRIKPALNMLRRGDYAEFQGVMGALSDMLGR